MSASPVPEDGAGDHDHEDLPPTDAKPAQTAENEDPNDKDSVPPPEHEDDLADMPEVTEIPDPLYAEVKEQDRWLPIANVARIMKTALPDNAKIAKEAKECMQECVSEFISFITSEASEKCQQEKRKTVNGEDILFAMTSLGFENYGEALKIYLSRYRETHVSKTEAAHSKTNGPVAAGEAATEAGQLDPIAEEGAAEAAGVEVSTAEPGEGDGSYGSYDV